MTDIKYTPGPWECNDDRYDDEPFYIIGRDMRLIATVPDRFGPMISGDDTDAANARLIAAAPAMLAVLLRALDEPRLPISLVGEVRCVVGLALGWSWDRIADDDVGGGA